MKLLNKPIKSSLIIYYLWCKVYTPKVYTPKVSESVVEKVYSIVKRLARLPPLQAIDFIEKTMNHECEDSLADWRLFQIKEMHRKFCINSNNQLYINKTGVTPCH